MQQRHPEMFEDMRQQVVASIMNQQPGSHATASQALNSNHQAVRDEVKGVLGKSKRRNSYVNNCPRWAGLICGYKFVPCMVGMRLY